MGGGQDGGDGRIVSGRRALYGLRDLRLFASFAASRKNTLWGLACLAQLSHAGAVDLRDVGKDEREDSGR